MLQISCLFFIFAFTTAAFHESNEFPDAYRMTPLSSVRSLPARYFDFSDLSHHASPIDIRNYLAGQIEKEFAPKPAPPPINNYRHLGQMLRNIQTRPPLPPMQTNLAASLTNFLLQNMKKVHPQPQPTQPILTRVSTIKNENLKQPQICFQFIDLSPKAVETLLNVGRLNKNESVGPQITPLKNKTPETATPPPAPPTPTITSTQSPPSNRDISPNDITNAGKVFMGDSNGYHKVDSDYKYSPKYGNKKFGESDSYFGDLPLPKPDGSSGEVTNTLT